MAIFDHLWVFEIVSGLNSVEHTNSEEPQTEEEEEFPNREEKRCNDYFNLVFTYVIFNIRDNAIHQNITLQNY